MSIQAIESFYIKIKKSESVQQELESIKKKLLNGRLSPLNAEEFIERGLIPLAKKLGFYFSLDDLMDYASKSHAEMLKQTKLLSEKELEAVSGGKGQPGVDMFLFLRYLGI